MAEQQDAGWQMSIVDFNPEVDPESLQAHELNARRHPQHQRDALASALDRVGWVDAVKVNTRTGRIVDGHARVEQALKVGSSVPVLWVDLDEEQERYVLATLDPIGAMAAYDSEVLNSLLEGVSLDNEQLSAMLAVHGWDGDLGDGTESNSRDSNGAGGGDPDERQFWPFLQFQVDPHVMTLWNQALTESGVDESSLLRSLLEAWPT